MPERPRVVIVDYGLGNLFSIQLACEKVGLQTVLSSSAREIVESDAIILPGVGAFADAMTELRRLDLVDVLRQAADSDKPMMGICLGMQLMMSEGFEFGRHEGLGIIEGSVLGFEKPRDASGRILKVPQVGWNRIHRPDGVAWTETPLDTTADGEFLYFVHSYYAVPRDRAVVLSVSSYGHVEFCSALRRGNIVAFQCHPERSGAAGLAIYDRFACRLTQGGCDV